MLACLEFGLQVDPSRTLTRVGITGTVGEAVIANPSREYPPRESPMAAFLLYASMATTRE